MKKLLFLLLITFTLSCCNNDNNPFSGSDQLPAETQTGANTAGCLINGQVFIPHQEGLTPELQCNYEFIDGQFYFTFRFSDFRNGEAKSVMLQSKKTTLQVNETYLLNKNMLDNGDFMGAGGMYLPTPSNIFYTNTIKTGELKITHLDLSNSIISGTFWFDSENSAGETVQIRSGRFDMHY
ncbi:MAG: hypothetical protein A3G95_04400 [Flavobacteria bacterium RIFCSPLOWO2_12_FULL_31_7]|jgi:hypothetical protein|nr:MAG: hypothetical protein A3G95_04400 [Flavobacteria bacterium RIFCSPLOWO2_12_FULL_31_7]